MVDSPPRLSDETLVARMAAGDDGALAVLYDRHAGKAFGIAYALIGNRDDAEEALSDAFVQCWEQADRFDSERGSVTAWLHTIVRSRAYDRARKTGRHARLAARAGEILSGVDASGGGAVPATLSAGNPGPDPERAASASQASEAVRRALAALPDEQRRAIELAWLAGLSQAEVAEELGAPLGTVKTRIRSGMGKLKDALGAYRSRGKP